MIEHLDEPDPAKASGEAPPGARPSERTVVFLVGAVQFINILDFMMVMPLGPDFASSLGIPTSHIGWIGASYTAAASLSGLAGSLFLDRFDRRSALAVAMGGLVLGTAAGGLATGLSTLMAARLIAGAFGGPATSVSLSIIADVVPVERRGKAMGAVMGAFSAASVLGVPAGLVLSQHGGWRAPFFSVAALGLAITGLALWFMPKMRGHLDARSASGEGAGDASAVALLRRPTVLLALAAPVTSMLAAFSMVPNLAIYFQYNAGYPRERLPLLYLVGGAISFFVLRLVGALVDRFGAPRIAAIGTVLYVSLLYVGFIDRVAWIPIMVLFVSFMMSNNFRQVATSTTSSRVPSPTERARFMSIQSAVQHMASAVASAGASAILVERADHSLDRMPLVAGGAACFASLLPLLLWLIERRLPPRAAPGSSPPARTGAVRSPTGA
jgi:predicted MFS family arabinose efflux permease